MRSKSSNLKMDLSESKAGGSHVQTLGLSTLDQTVPPNQTTAFCRKALGEAAPKCAARCGTALTSKFRTWHRCKESEAATLPSNKTSMENNNIQNSRNLQSKQCKIYRIISYLNMSFQCLFVGDVKICEILWNTTTYLNQNPYHIGARHAKSF